MPQPATAFQELSQLPQLHPDHVLMRCRDAGVEADARERADLAFEVAKNPIARVSILARFFGPSRGRFRHGHNLYFSAMTVAVAPEAQAPKNGRFIAAEGGAGSYSRKVTHGPLEGHPVNGEVGTWLAPSGSQICSPFACPYSRLQ